MKYKSLYETTKIVSDAIDKGKSNRALQLIHDFVEAIITEPLCTAHVNGSREMDSLCQRVGQHNYLKLVETVAREPKMDNGTSVFVYIATRLQKSGGHTRVIESFIASRPKARHVVLITGLSGRSDCSYTRGRLDLNIDIDFESVPTGDFEKKLNWLQKKLIEIAPEHIYLFNHPQDSVAVAAIQPDMNFNASFYHHADHHLCLGVFLSHLEHIDIHSTGYHHCREALGISNRYLPLVVEDKGARASHALLKHNGSLTTCTAARSNKIESPYFINYLTVIPQLLKATKGTHIHIGRLTPWALFRLRRGLKREGVHATQFVYIPWVSSVWKTLHERHVDLYIASFPYGGGLTLIEAMGAGVAVALHKHIYSRLLSGVDLAYPEAFLWREPEELLHYCASVTKATLREQGQRGRQHYEQFNRCEIFDDLINNKQNNGTVPVMINNRYQVKPDEWVCWMKNELGFGRLFGRVLYRFFRQGRRVFGRFFNQNAIKL
jgi:hypothetical protein